MTTLGHDNPADSRGVTVALAAFHHELATGAGSRLAMLAALRAVASLMKDEIAEEAAVITMETVLEATAIANARVAELERAAGDMLSRFRDPYGFPIPFCPSLAQYDRWRDVLYGGEQK